MQYPQLILPQFCNTDIRVILYSNSITEDGAPQSTTEITTKCMLKNGGSKRIFDDKGTEVQISLVASIPGDIAPLLPFISGGSAVINNESFRIVSGSKIHNPNNSVNFTRLELI